ncbi:MAG: site-specific integrase [Alteromonadaceae bacterium]|nr:site-specific integrase [Alteromonadaceae bacterium]
MSLNQISNARTQLHDIEPLNDVTPLVNRLTENVFTLRDIVNDEDYKVDLYHSSLTPMYQFWIKECFVSLCGGWNHTELQTLSARRGTSAHWKNSLLRIGVWASEHYPLLPLSRWTESHVKELILATLENKIEWTDNKSEIEPLNRGALENVCLILQRSRNLKLKGELSDGICFDFPKHFLKISVEMKLKSYDVSYHDWVKGDSWTSIPLPVAMTLLHDAILVLKDKKTLFLRDYFEHQRSSNPFPTSAIESGSFDKILKMNAGKGIHLDLREKAEGITSILNRHFTGSAIEFPFQNEASISKHCNNVHDACIVIFLCLSGVRLSELASICADDYKQEADGTWVFDSELIKTNHGIIEVREMSGLLAEVADTLCGLSYIVKRKRTDKAKLPLFGRYFFPKDFNNHINFRSSRRSATKSSLRHRLNVNYNTFIQKHPEFEEHCDSIHPHRFRHTWAEFALRRFEGNVFEAIRRHFRHSYGSYFTTHYVFGKLSDEVRDQIEKEYLKEILTKLATENVQAAMDDDFKRDLHGKVAYYISKSMDVTILTEVEIDDFVDSLAEEFESIVAHEYGYCLVRKDMKHLAKCIDKKTQTPVLKNGCFELCSGCINFVSSKDSNKDSITRIAVSHQNMIANFTNLMGDNVKSSAIDASKQTLKRAEEMLDEMES